MAKRFTDTDKWQDEWWGSLPNDYRMIWLYLVDRCSIAGIWKKDLTLDEFKRGKVKSKKMMGIRNIKEEEVGKFIEERPLYRIYG